MSRAILVDPRSAQGLLTNRALNPAATSVEVLTGTRFVVGTNYATTPVPTSSTSWLYQLGTGEASTITRVAASDGPEVANGYRLPSWLRATIDTPKSGGLSGFYMWTASPAPGSIGARGRVALYVRSSTTVDVRLRASWRNSASPGVLPAGEAYSETLTLAPGQWARLVSDVATSTAPSSDLGWMLELGATSLLPAGATLDVTGVLVSTGPNISTYYDGSFSPDPELLPEWRGTAYASISDLKGVRVPNWSMLDTGSRYVITGPDGPMIQAWDDADTGAISLVYGWEITPPASGVWVATGVNVLAYDDASASGVDLALIANGDTVMSGTDYVDRPVASGSLTRITHVRQVTSQGTGSVTALVRAQDVIPGGLLGACCASIVFASTQEQALADVSRAFDGGTPWAKWDGTPGNSTSTGLRGFVLQG